MRVILIIGAALALAACQPASPPPADAVDSNAYTIGNVGLSTAAKFCDSGRAVYVVDGYNSPAVHVVPDAPECAA